MKAFLLTFETRVPIWIDMKLKMPRSKGFPPKVVYFNGRHVGFTNEYAGAYKYWLQKDRSKKWPKSIGQIFNTIL